MIVLPAQLDFLFCQGLPKAVQMRGFIVRNNAIEMKNDGVRGSRP